MKDLIALLDGRMAKLAMTTTIKTVIEECATTRFKFVVMRWPCIHHPSLRHTSVAAHKLQLLVTYVHAPASTARRVSWCSARQVPKLPSCRKGRKQSSSEHWTGRPLWRPSTFDTRLCSVAEPRIQGGAGLTRVPPAPRANHEPALT